MSWKFSLSAVRALLVSLSLTLGACGDDDAMCEGALCLPDMSTPASATLLFEIDGPPAFGQHPFPDDAFLGDALLSDGGIQLPEFPVETSEYTDSLRAELATLDGFSPVASIYFPLDGAIDPASLPPDAASTLSEDASVFLVNLTASTETLARTPVTVAWQPDAQAIVITPARGRPLAPGGRYAAVITSRVLDPEGAPLAAAPDFAQLRGAAARPSDPTLGAYYERYAPVLATLDADAATIVGLSVFRVQSITEELAMARAIIREGELPEIEIEALITAGEGLDAVLGADPGAPGLGREGGVAHENIAWMIHGHFSAPWFLSDASNQHGKFTQEDGVLQVRREVNVPFTLLLPVGVELQQSPIVVFQHGIGSERSDALGIADRLCSAGYAIMSIDAPWHGERAPGSGDTRNRFTGESGEGLGDGFGDATGASIVVNFAGILDNLGELTAFHPVYLRDALRQGASDVMMAIRVAQEADWAALLAPLDARLAGVRLETEDVALIGNSLGGIISTLVTATEPEVDLAVLSVTGGSLVDLVMDSPPFNDGYFPLLLPLLLPLLGADPYAADYAHYPPSHYPQLALWQTLLDRGDSIAYGRAVAASHAHVLMLMAQDDETMNNASTEALARAIQLPIVGAAPRYTDLTQVSAPLAGNITQGADVLTRGLLQFAPATHGLLIGAHGTVSYAHPVWPPFEAVESATIDNPIQDAQDSVMHFLETWRAPAVPQIE